MAVCFAGASGGSGTVLRKRLECAPLLGCGTQHPHRALDGTCVLLAAVPTTPPCIPPFVTCGDIFPRRGGSLCSLAAVVVVVLCAYSAEKLLIIEQCRAVCGPPGIAFSRVGSWRKTASAALVSCGNSRAAGSVLALSVCSLRSHPPLPKGEALAWRHSFRLNCEVYGFARGSPFGRAGIA